MGLVVNLLERLGFVRLRDYGLVLSAQRRVLTTRTAVLDDGFGGIVVGWTDSDLASTELATWTAKPRAAVVAPKPVPVAPKPSPPPIPQPVQTAAAREPEDEWEWEIAMARARAASDPPPPPRVVAPPPPRVVAPPRAAFCDDADAVTQLSGAATVISIAQPPGSTPRTIIPVPVLPAASDPRRIHAFDDSMRRLPPAPRRFPSATRQRATAANDDDASTVVVARPAFASQPIRSR